MSALGESFWPVVGLVFGLGIAGGLVLFQFNASRPRCRTRRQTPETSGASAATGLTAVAAALALVLTWQSFPRMSEQAAPSRLSSVPFRVLGEKRFDRSLTLAITMDLDALLDRHAVQDVLRQIEVANHEKLYIQVLAYDVGRLTRNMDDERNTRFMRWAFWRNRANGNSEFVWLDIDAIMAEPSRFVRTPDSLRP